jgi:hypothetical protein
MLVFLSALAGGAVLVAIALAVLPLKDDPKASPPPSPSHWPESQRASFIENCVKSCRNAPGAAAAAYPLCDQACGCAADEGEKFVTVNELAMIVLAEKVGMASSEQKEKIQKLKDASLSCMRKLAH